MKKKIYVRPLFIAMALCEGDIAAATLFSEIMFRANITKLSDGEDPLLAMPVKDWSALTGYSPGQVNKALNRLEAMGLIIKYVKPWGTALKVTHIRISKDLHTLFSGLSHGMFEYIGDNLKMNMFKHVMYLPGAEITTDNPVAIEHAPCAIDLAPVGDTDNDTGDKPNASTGGEDKEKQLEKKKGLEIPTNKFAGMSAGEKSKGKIEETIGITDKTMSLLNIPKTLQPVIHLPLLLLKMRVWYGLNFEKSVDAWDGEFFTGSHLAAIWRDRMYEKYGDYVCPNLSGQAIGLLTLTLKLHGRELTCKVMDVVFDDWEEVCDAVVRYSDCTHVPSYPDPVFVYRYFSSIVNGCKIFKPKTAGQEKMEKLKSP